MDILTLFLTLTSFANCLNQFGNNAQNNANNFVDKFVANQAKRERADEYEEARKIIRGDLNGDGKEDVAVLYTLEGFGGTNLYLQYLAVFINRGNKFVYATQRRVGGKNQRILELKSIAKGQINFETQEYLRQDASCCPSGKGHARFTFNNGKLKEIKLCVSPKAKLSNSLSARQQTFLNTIAPQRISNLTVKISSTQFYQSAL